MNSQDDAYGFCHDGYTYVMHTGAFVNICYSELELDIARFHVVSQS